MPGLLQNSLLMPPASHASNGARLVSTTGEALPLRSIALTADAMGGIARTRLRQHFANTHPTPLELTYAFPLPADGAVSGYEIRAGERVIRGRVEPRAKAHAEFEHAHVTGRTAGLVDEERPNFFTQRLGNIPAATDVVVELTIDHPLAWIAAGEWEWRFPTVIAPRYMGAEGAVPDAGTVTVDVADRPTSATASVSLTIADDFTAAPSSPSHALAADGHTVTLANGAPLDRDIVVRWHVARQEPGLTLRRARPVSDAPADRDAAFGLLTIVPPAGLDNAVARDLVLLLDVSGSMDGQPLRHLKAVVHSLIDSLDDRDRLEMIAFDTNRERYRPAPVYATPSEKYEARVWVEALRTGGGTEMISAIEDALKPMRGEATRQVVIVTDGLIGFEAGALRAIRDGLPRGSRFHAVGIGSAANRAFLQPAARAGRGVEVNIGLNEPAAPGAARILAATRHPDVVDVTFGGSALLDTAPVRVHDLLAGAPVVTGVRLRPDGGTLVVSGRTAAGTWEQRVNVPATLAGEGSDAIAALWAREAIQSLELDLACRGSRQEIDAQIEAIALRHSIASRLTSWIAVSETPTVDPREPVRVERIPQMLPYGMSEEGLGLMDTSATMTLGISALHSFEPSARAVGTPMLRSVRRATPLASPGTPAVPPEVPDEAELIERRLSFERRHVEASRLARLLAELRDRLQALIERLERAPRREMLVLRGQVIPTPERPTTTIEIFMESDMDWQPAPKAVLSSGTVDVVERGTTRAGEISAGSLVRVEISAANDQIARSGGVEIQNGPVRLAVALTGGARRS
jgi:Ca-activated chloride channel family protein